MGAGGEGGGGGGGLMEGANRSSEIPLSKSAPRLLSACQDQIFLFPLWNLLSCPLAGKWDLHCARESCCGRSFPPRNF